MRALAIVALLGMAGIARADEPELADALRLEANLEFDKALAIVEQLIASGHLGDRERLAELHFYAGKLAAGLEHTDTAIDHFSRALALSPQRSLPEGTSPKIAEPFRIARERTVPLQLQLRKLGPGSYVVIASGDRNKLVATAVARYRIGGPFEQIEVRDPEETGVVRMFRFTVPSDQEVDLFAYDAYGNELAREAFVPEQRHMDESWTLHRPQHGLAGRWTTWAAVSGVALAGAGLCAWRFSVAQDDWNRLHSEPGQHDYSELTAVESRGEHWALAANIGFGVAGAAALTAALLAVLHHDEARVALTASGRSFGVAGRF